MSMRIWTEQMRWLVVAGVVLGTGMLVQAQDASDADPSRFESEPARDLDRDPAGPWIGIVCRPIDDALRAHTGLPGDQGLLIVAVGSDCPAEEAGLQRNDILLRANERRLTRVGQLAELVRESKSQPIELAILRAGKEQTIRVEPAKRSTDEQRFGQRPPNADWLKRWVDKLDPVDRPPRENDVAEDGVVGRFSSLPAEVSVQISKRGNEPAQIAVTEAEESWEVSEDELDQLPKRVQVYVERVLGRSGGVDFPFEELDELKSRAGRKVEEALRQAYEYLPKDETLQKRLDVMEQRLDDLTEQIRKLQKAEAEN